MVMCLMRNPYSSEVFHRHETKKLMKIDLKYDTGFYRFWEFICGFVDTPVFSFGWCLHRDSKIITESSVVVHFPNIC